MESGKVSNMMWRQVGEAVLFSLCVGALIVYLLISYGFAVPFRTWQQVLTHSVSAIGALTAAGAIFGFWRSLPVRGRLRLLSERMTMLEKGMPSPSLPPLGNDEIGRLGDQLGKLGRKWEEQVATLQRLS